MGKEKKVLCCTRMPLKTTLISVPAEMDVLGARGATD